MYSSKNQTLDELIAQVSDFKKNGRKFALRIRYGNEPADIKSLIFKLSENFPSEMIIILEGGWVRDALMLEAWFKRIIDNDLSVINQVVHIVVSCTTMIKTFSTLKDGISFTEFYNHSLIERISSSTKNKIIFGDWGSTNPRQEPHIMMPPLNRIDYPLNNGWHIARNKGAEWDFQRAADAILSHPSWDPSLEIWGTEMIKRTATSSAMGIQSASKNVAARVNIHLFHQAFQSAGLPLPTNTDEDYED